MSEAQQHRLALPQGTRIRDFEFHRVLGHGGFGITYLGWNLSLDIPVAIKEYLPADLATREQDLSVVPQTSQAAADFQWGLERFVDEARTLARFQHPNIVRVHQYFEAHSTAYIVMDYVEGETLSAHLERKGTLSEAELTGILYPLLNALEVVHGADFLHRDIKPGNIVLRDSDNSPVLLDFGAARQAVGAKSRSVTSIVTPGYAPIEQYSSRGRQGAWTDIYALGGVCYRALTGQGPEDATDRMRHDPLVPVAQQCAGRASQELLAAVDWALSVDEGNRPQSVGAWREAMEGTAAEAAGQERKMADASDVRGKEQTVVPSEPVVSRRTSDALPSDTKEKAEGEPKSAKSKDIPLMETQKKNNAVAVLLSLLVTGAGQIYAGATTRGVVHIFIYCVLCALTGATGVMAIFLIPYWIWGMINANKQVNKYNLEIDRKQANAEEAAKKTISASEFIEQLEKISKLHGANLLNQEEFNSRKRTLILSLIDRKPKEAAEDFLAALIPSIERKYLSEPEIAQIKKLVM